MSGIAITKALNDETRFLGRRLPAACVADWNGVGGGGWRGLEASKHVASRLDSERILVNVGHVGDDDDRDDVTNRMRCRGLVCRGQSNGQFNCSTVSVVIEMTPPHPQTLEKRC